MLGLVLLLQMAAAGPCATAQLCRLLDSATAANGRAMEAPRGYRATAETEAATIGRREGRIEGAITVEQTTSLVRWTGSGGFEQHVVGSRSFPNAIPLSRLAFLRIGWLIPTLHGERLQVIPRTGAEQTRLEETQSGPLAPQIVVHPLASDRAAYYVYAGGAAVVRTFDGTARRVYVVEVAPVESLPAEEILFEGEMHLDVETLAVARLFGRIRAVGPPRSGGFFNFDPAVTLVDLLNAPLPDGHWAPAMQRFEIQTASSLASGYGATRRVISHFDDRTPLPPGEGTAAVAAATAGYLLTSAPNDSLRRYRRWRRPAGHVSRSAAGGDFSRFRPGRLQGAGPPQLLVQGFHIGDFFRFNRIEGVYTGLSLIAEFRNAAPGLSLRAMGGYAWSEKTGRGAFGLAWTRRSWTVEAGAARSLDVTNKFRNQFDNPATGGIAGRDPWDYVDRRGAGAAVIRALGDERGSIARFEVSRVEDSEVAKHLDKSPFGGVYRENRGITPGSYWRTRALLDWNPAVSPLFARDGVGFRGEIETAGGDLDYARVEGRIVARKSLAPIFFIARLHAGAVFASRPPPQQLFELGGSAGLPGYEYKEFAGDRAMLLRVRVSYPIAMLDVPFRIGSGVTLPSLAPAISLGFQGAMTDTRTAGGPSAVRALGEVTPPVSVGTDGLRTSIDIRIGFFGDALAVGVARALAPGRATRFIFAFGRQF